MLLDDVRIQWKQAQQEANSVFPKYGIQIYIPLAIVIVSAIFEIIFSALNNAMVALPSVFINWGALICLSVQYRFFKRNNAAAIAAYERKMRSTFEKIFGKSVSEIVATMNMYRMNMPNMLQRGIKTLREYLPCFQR